MATCKDCVHFEVCRGEYAEGIEQLLTCDGCEDFKDRSQFVELTIAKKIKHTPDIDKMREFHKLGLGSGMGEHSIFWICSDCKLWVSLVYKFCPYCGAKFEAEQALKERESNA